MGMGFPGMEKCVPRWLGRVLNRVGIFGRVLGSVESFVEFFGENACFLTAMVVSRA